MFFRELKVASLIFAGQRGIGNGHLIDQEHRELFGWTIRAE